jgi:hypothetical protein
MIQALQEVLCTLRVSSPRRIGYIGGPVHLLSEAEAAKGGAELVTLHAVSASAPFAANPEGSTLSAAGGADLSVKGLKSGDCQAVAILAA